MARARSAPAGANSGTAAQGAEDEEDEEGLQRQRKVVDEMQMMERGTDQSKVRLKATILACTCVSLSSVVGP